MIYYTKSYKLKVIFGSSDTTLYGCDRKVLSLLFFNEADDLMFSFWFSD